ncbi:MAG: glycoside hydrolase [Paludibacter sp.]|jgi:polygalacturonase|nr:glycoside hydrolase [Paludibacter sp.]
MKSRKFFATCSALVIVCCSFVAQAQKSWDGIHNIPLATAQTNFVNPPANFANHVIWGWQGNIDIKVIRADLDSMYHKGFRSVIIEAGYELPFEYLSDKWFSTVALAVKEAKKRGMKVWIIDEGKYPSGFAGGKFSRERPDLRMQALVACDTIHIEAGKTLVNHPVDTFAISAVAINRHGQADRIVPVNNHQISFNAGISAWDIVLIRSDFRTAQTRAVNDPTHGKTTANSICDYLNPAAVRQFIDWTHEQYKKYLGKELGTTVLGFRGDEPDYAHIPFTPAIIETFKERKGYDPTPYLATLIAGHTGDFNFRTVAPVPYPSAQFAAFRSEDEKRFKADYWDVWSEMFAVNFFEQQAKWCAENSVAHITHLNNEHNMPVCVRAEGDFFRNLSKVQIPGVDAIWNQIWHGTVNNFPKLASSVAHVYGKPRSFSESFAAYDVSPTIPEAKYVVDYQIVRGINFFEFMFWMSGSKRANWMSSPQMADLNAYSNRSVYLMSQGVPGARIAVYYPTSTMWLGNNEVFTHITSISETLLQHKRDFDYINDDAFNQVISVNQGYLQNGSGQKYYTLIIPSADAITADAWAKIEEFASRGGKLLFWGKKPDMLVDKTFTKPQSFPADFSKYLAEPSSNWTATVEAAMPDAEMSIQLSANRINARRQNIQTSKEPATNFIRYTRRVLPDADIYFIFNEADSACSFTAEFDKIGVVQQYNGVTGEISNIAFSVKNNKTIVKFEMAAWESRIISIKKSDRQFDITNYAAIGDGKTVNTTAIQNVIDSAYRSGGGCVVVPKGEFVSGALFFPQGVDLNIKKDGVLISTVNADDFPVISTRFEGIERAWRCAFLNFDNSNSVRVFGEGSVDGKGVDWKTIPFGTGGRPRLICFSACDGGSISGLTLRDQASWCVHVLYSDGFTISDLDIRAEHTIPSSDGLDIDSSNDIKIERVYIDVNDDCISIKSGKDTDGRRVARASENIVINNCHFAYGHGGVALGSEITGCIRNVTIKNCLIDGDNWGPIRFKSQPSRAGIVENIVFDSIIINNARMLLDINMEWRMVGQLEPTAENLTQLRNIKISNISATTRSVGTMYGYADAPFGSDVFHFENCNVSAQTGLSMSNADAVSLEGLNITVQQGEKTFKRKTP